MLLIVWFSLLLSLVQTTDIKLTNAIPCSVLLSFRQNECMDSNPKTVVKSCLGKVLTCNDLCIEIAKYCSYNSQHRIAHGGCHINQTYTHTPTATHTATSTRTFTNTKTSTSSFTKTSTFSYTASATSTDTTTNTATNTFTSTITSTPSSTISNSFTSTPTSTASNSFTNTPTSTSSSSNTFTNTRTSTFTNTPTITQSYTFTSTSTNSFSATPTSTSTATSTYTASNTFTSTLSTRTPTSTFTSTFTSTSTPTPTPTCLKLATNFNSLMQCDNMYSYYTSSTTSTYNLTSCQSSPTYAASIGMATYGNLVTYASTYATFGTNICNLQTEVANYLILTSLCNLTTITQQIIGSVPYTVALETLLFPQFAANYGLNNSTQLVGWTFQIDPSYNVYNSWTPVMSKSSGVSLQCCYSGTDALKTQCIKSLSAVYIDGGYFYMPDSFGLFYSTFIQAVEIYNLQLDDYLTPCGTAPGMTGYTRTLIVLYDCYLTPAGSGTQYLKLMMPSSIVYFQWVENLQPVAITTYFQQAVNASGTPLAANLTFLFLDYATTGDTTTLDLSTIQWSYHFPSLLYFFIIGPAKLTGTINDTYFANVACLFIAYTGNPYSIAGHCNLPHPPTPTATPTPTHS